MNKETCRKNALEKRNSLSGTEIKEKSRVIFEKLGDMELYRNASNILIYASMGSEASTDEIMLDALSLGKKVFCPKVTDKKAGIMEFVRIDSPEDLAEGYFHIREPEISDGSELYDGQDSENTLVIMPLVAFDDNLDRIGYGGGFYDRYLERFEKLMTVAIAFECQKSDELLPSTDVDIKPGIIITEVS